MRLHARVAVACLGALVAACSAELREGVYGCTTDDTCPAGWSCVGGRCYRASTTPECRVDLHCDDGSVCTLDICEGGRCTHEPQAGDCDDGDFCNGADTCAEGLCANVGPPPCPPDSCMATGCTDCGGPGGACCAGDVCAPGTACVSGICETCGSSGQSCCFGECSDPGAVCLGDYCATCGGDGEPCCGLGACNTGLQCLGDVCGPSSGCEMISCPGTEVCIDGACVPCGGFGGPCCSDGTCVEGFCMSATWTCLEMPSCGGSGDICCPTNPPCIDPTTACVADGTGLSRCYPCGFASGAPCCTDSATQLCADGLACNPTSVTCEPCGRDLQRCCGGVECQSDDLSCVRGFCRVACGGPGEPCCAGACASPYLCNMLGMCGTG